MNEPEQLSAPEWRRTWRIITWAGFLGGTYYLLCINGIPRVKYLTELGATPFDFGLISTLGALVLSFQVVGSMVANRLARRKKAWIVLAVSHRLMFAGVLVAPLLFSEPRLCILWILCILFSHDALAQCSVPLWFSWMADLVPKETMSRHWAARQRIITAATIVVMLLIALSFGYFESAGRIVLGFTILASIGIVMGVVDIFMFLAVPEPEHERVQRIEWRKVLLQPILDRDFRGFLIFMGYWHFAVFLAAPFFGLYILEVLGYSVRTVQLLGTAAALGVVISSHFWGLACDVFGYRPMLQILTVLKLFTPAAYLLAPHNPAIAVWYFAVVWFIDGMLNSGLTLSIQGPMLKFTPRKNRAMYIAAANFLAIGMMASIAPVLSGYTITAINANDISVGGLGVLNGYHVAFAASLLFRVCAFPLAARIVEPAAAPVSTVIRHIFSLNAFRTTKWVHQLHAATDERRRIHAAQRLGELHSPMAIGELCSALRDTSHAVRDAAAEALGKLGSHESTQALVDALFDPDRGIQSPAARALGRIGGINSLRGLLRYLHNRRTDALMDTVDSLVAIGDDAAILPLVCLFNETEDAALRDHIARALGRWSRVDSLEEIVDLLYARRPISQQIIK